MPNPTLMFLLWSLLLLATASSGRADTPAQSMSGNELVAKAADALMSHQSIRCKLNVDVRLFGQQMVAEGSYRQLGVSQPKLFRLELAMQAGDSSASLLQVCDGDFVWIRREVGGKIATRQIDLRRVRQAIDRAPADSLSDPMQAWLTIGGLPRLFTGLQRSFDFGTAQVSQLGDRDVWTVKGTSKSHNSSDSRETVLATDDDQEPLANRIPETVSLTLAKSDLFPYYIEFSGRAVSSANPSQDNTGTPRRARTVFISTEDIQTGGDPLDFPNRERDFTFRPGIATITDYTDEFIKQLGL